MKRHSMIFHPALLALALALPLAAQAEPGGGPCFPPHHPGKAFEPGQLPPHLQELNLSDSQKTQLEELFKTQGAALREQFEAGRKNRDALRKLAMSADYSEDKARALAESGAKQMAETALAHARLDQAVYQLLTPDQRQQMQDGIAKMEARCQGKKE